MNGGLRGDAADILAAVGKHWSWLAVFGLITALTGVVVLIWPGRTVVVVAVLFGIELIVAGIFRFVAALASDDESGGTRVLLALLGVLSFIVGLYALRHIQITVVALALLVGIFWIVNGFVELFTALSYRRMPGRGWTAVMGLLSILAGVVVLAYPGISLLALAIVLGAWLVVFGIMELVLAFQLRAATRTLARAIPAT